MSRTSRFIMSALPWAAATALLCAVTVPGTNAAWAQTATDLNCKKCVKKSEIDRKAVSKGKIKKGAVKLNKLNTALQDHIGEREGFYITLDVPGGVTSTTKTIGTLGPLTMFARCLLNQPDGGGGFEDRLEIVSTSSAGGWFEADEGGTPLAAGQQVIGETQTINPPGGPVFELLQDIIAVAPDGSFMALEGDAGATGINVFGHDCIVAGNVYRITGTL